jgi:hypothetical protein
VKDATSEGQRKRLGGPLQGTFSFPELWGWRNLDDPCDAWQARLQSAALTNEPSTGNKTEELRGA